MSTKYAFSRRSLQKKIDALRDRAFRGETVTAYELLNLASDLMTAEREPTEAEIAGKELRVWQLSGDNALLIAKREDVKIIYDPVTGPPGDSSLEDTDRFFNGMLNRIRNIIDFGMKK